MLGIISFIALTFGIAWVNWGIVIHAGVSALSWQFELYNVPGAFAPAIAAFIVRKWITREGFGDAGLKSNFRSWPYFLFGLFLPLVVCAAIVGEAVALGIGAPDFTLKTAVAHGVAGHDVRGLAGLGLLVVPLLLASAIPSLFIHFGEEFGWRGYLQPRLFPGRRILSAVCTGLIWGPWHFPLIWQGYDFPENPILGCILLTMGAIFLSYIFGWLREKSGNIWAPSLAHSSTDIVGGLAPLWLAGSGAAILISYAGFLAMGPLLLVCVGIFFASRR